jgi:hypothetical protein
MTRRFRWLVTVLALIPFIGALVWRIGPGSLGFARQEVTLTNGVTLRLASVQYGTLHMDPFTSPWKQWAAKLTKSWSQRLKITVPANLGLGGSNSTMSVWLTRSQTPSDPKTEAYSVLVGDDEDNFAGARFTTQIITGRTPSIAHYEAHQIYIVPRRARELRIRVYDHPFYGGRFVHEFRIPNPGFVPTNAILPLVAEPLPQTKTSGDFEATLVSFAVQPPELDSPPPDPIYRSARLNFTMRQGGQPTTNWIPDRVRTVFDATGNVGGGGGWSYSPTKDGAFIDFSWPLPACEPWRMEVEFRQHHGFSSNEISAVRRIPIQSGDGRFAPITHQLPGAQIEIFGLIPSAPGESEAVGRRGCTLVVGPVIRPDDRVCYVSIAKAVDSTGLDVTPPGWNGSEGGRAFQFQVATNATSIDVWMAYTPSRVLEFTAQPSVPPEPARTNAQPRP